MNRFEKSLDRIKKRVEIGGNWTDEDIEHYKTIVEALKMAAEVKHGNWLDRDGKTWCSLCGESNKQYKPPYCPHCGAKMDKGVIA